MNDDAAASSQDLRGTPGRGDAVPFTDRRARLEEADLSGEPDGPDELDDVLDPREAARVRRRDHDAQAERRALMRSGMGKVFKQILDRQARDTDEPQPRERHHRHRG